MSGTKARVQNVKLATNFAGKKMVDCLDLEKKKNCLKDKEIREREMGMGIESELTLSA